MAEKVDLDELEDDDEEMFRHVVDKAMTADEKFLADQPVETAGSQVQSKTTVNSLLASELESMNVKKKSVYEDDDDYEEPEEIPPEGFLEYINHMAVQFSKLFVDYGPPYTREPLPGSLVDECSELSVSLFTVHSLLNMRANPNVPDPEDLYYTPMHWCGRNFHLLAAKMLRHAGAEVSLLQQVIILALLTFLSPSGEL